MDTQTTTGLSKADIAALRLADDVYAVLYEDEYKLRAVKRPSFAERERNPFADDQTVDITVDGAVTVYGEHGGNDFARSAEVTACFASLWRSESIWQIVKPGDKAKLRFTANNNNENLRAIGYDRDEVTIEIIRKADTNGRRPLQFLAAVYVGPNNSARFVRSSIYGL